MRSRDLSIAIVGASGAVGREAVAILAERGHPADRVRAFASKRSAGDTLPFGPHQLAIEPYSAGAAEDSDAVVLCTSAAVARDIAPKLAARGLWVIDNSSAFRADSGVPLVIPEINAESLPAQPSGQIVANPNCSTIMLLIATEPIRAAFGIRSLTVSTYQAVSGAGLAGITELEDETARALRGQPSAPSVFPHTCAFNVFPHESARADIFSDCGEERKMIEESRRILGAPDLDILPTCVRVPVARCHAQSIVVDTETATTPRELARAFEKWSAAEVVQNAAVTPANTERTDRIRIGSIRASASRPETRFSIWACCDQVRKGAALNAIQILDQLTQARSSPASRRTPRASTTIGAS